MMLSWPCRTAHRNVGQMQDLYLPTNALAALANLAPQVIAPRTCLGVSCIG
jgi:hypothetical protein